MKDVIDGIKNRDPAFKNNLEVILYPGFWAVLFHRLAHRLYGVKCFFLPGSFPRYRVCSRALRSIPAR